MTPSDPIRIVFFDIDGTLYRKETDTLPESIKAAIRALKKRDIIPAIATGRTGAAFPKKIENLIAEEKIDLIVTINGQYNQYQNRVISSHPIAKEDIITIISKLNTQRIDYALITENTMSVSADTSIVKKALKDIGEYIVNPKLHLDIPIYQMLIFCDEKQELLMREQLLPENYQILRWHPESVDLLPKGASKVRGIKAACHTLDIKISETMAFGDGHNDVEMLSSVGIGIAMGDAREAVLAIADDRTDTLENDGILKALRRYGLAD